MIVFFGTRFYGKVDRVPGLWYVVTRFAHVQYFPLAPLGSYLIFDLPGGRGDRGVRIPLRLKSVPVAWLRAACVLATFVGGIFLLANILPERRDPDHFIAAIGVMAGSVALFGLSYLLTGAGGRRTAELAARLGISEAALADMLASPDDRAKRLSACLAAGAAAAEKPRRRRRGDEEDEDELPPEERIRADRSR